jgi:hypothetical protein
MILAQAVTGLMFLIVAAGFAAIHGGMAHRLGLPLGSLARWSFWLIPVIALLPCVLPRRIRRWKRILACDLLVIGLVYLPLAVFHGGARSFSLPNGPSAGLSRKLEAELGLTVALVGDSDGWNIYFPRGRDGTLVRKALLRHRIKVFP